MEGSSIPQASEGSGKELLVFLFSTVVSSVGDLSKLEKCHSLPQPTVEILPVGILGTKIFQFIYNKA